MPGSLLESLSALIILALLVPLTLLYNTNRRTRRRINDKINAIEQRIERRINELYPTA